MFLHCPSSVWAHTEDLFHMNLIHPLFPQTTVQHTSSSSWSMKFKQGRVSTYWTSIYMLWNNGCICLYNTPLNFSLHIFLTKNICSIVFMCMSAWLYICMYTTCVPILKEARKGHQILCKWNLRNLLTIMWILGTEFISSIIAASALNHQIISAHSRYSLEIIKE